MKEFVSEMANAEGFSNVLQAEFDAQCGAFKDWYACIIRKYYIMIV